MPRVRAWPAIAEPVFEGLVAYKAGMTHVAMTDDSEGPGKGMEVVRAVTVMEIPKIYLYGIRAYKKKYLYTEPFAEVYDAVLAKRVGIKAIKSNDLNALRSGAAEFERVTALCFLDAGSMGFGNKRVMRFEVPVGGKDTAEKFAFVEKWLGKEVKVSDVLSAGEYIDVTGISKGKGWAGVIKRFGVSRNVRKATGKVRHVGVLGAWHPAKVMFTVPHAGHMGYNYRTELNKRVLRVGTAADASTVNVKGGFPNFGNVKSDFIIVDGSVPGPAKRLLRIRKALRSTEKAKVPQMAYLSQASKQGA
ncbi:MAG: 50S ribosomal protein L3 [Candidatus Marsarchaeota archaeon]|nr:50S ribosomal protein L3 [Candidatus Marsarchaeota archaeon]